MRHTRVLPSPVQNSSGVSTLELALVLPITIIILLGLIDFGMAYARMNTIASAAREGARLAAHARPRGSNVPLPETSTPAREPGCPGSRTSCCVRPTPAPPAPPSAYCAAVWGVRNALEGGHLNPDEFDIAVAFSPVTDPPGAMPTGSRAITVRIQRPDTSRWCLFCFGNLIGGERGRATFLRERPRAVP